MGKREERDVVNGADSEFSALPNGWYRGPLAEVLEVHYGKALQESRRLQNGKVPVYGSSGVVGHHTEALAPGPCVVVGRKGAVGKVHYSDVPCWPIDTTYYVVPPEGVSAKYIYYLLHSLALGRLDRSTAIPGLSRDDLYAETIPVAPCGEQHRIVAAIETQFTRLDGAVAALKRVQARLRRYKASALKAACEGRLVPTEAELARAEGRDYEPAEVLLQRILAERRARWEAEHPGKRYQDPKSPDTAELPELPEGWVWMTHGQAVALSQNGLGKRSSESGRATVVLRLADVVDGERISLEDTRRIGLEAPEIAKYRLFLGDALCIRVNGSPNLVGRMVPFRGSDEPMAFCDHFIRYRFAVPDAMRMPLLCFGTDRVRRYVDTHKVSSAGQNTVSQGVMEAIAVPLAPLAEQHRIIAEVERRLSVAQELKCEVERALRHCDRLQQSILKRALEGRLVPQDPNDEPASVLLDRIRTERQGQATVRPRQDQLPSM